MILGYIVYVQSFQFSCNAIQNVNFSFTILFLSYLIQIIKTVNKAYFVHYNLLDTLDKTPITYINLLNGILQVRFDSLLFKQFISITLEILTNNILSRISAYAVALRSINYFTYVFNITCS